LIKLQIKDDAGRTTTVSLTRDEYTLGRLEGNTIRLTEKNVSRKHARLFKKGDEVHIEDLSRYGTRINGERINGGRRLQDSDVVIIGDYELQLEGVQPFAAAPPPEAEAPAPAPAPAPPARKKKSAAEAAALEKEAKARIAAAKAAAAEDSPPREVTTSVAAAKDDEPAPPTDAEEAQRVSRGKGKKRIEAAHPMLVAVTSQLAGTSYPVTTETMILGRTGENDLVVEHHSISRNHAKIVYKDGRVTMVDLASKNGIRVNGEFWEESVLKSGDIIELGKVQFRFVERGEDFIFRPEEWAAGAARAADEAPAKKGGKTWLFLLLLLALGGAVVIYLATRGPAEVSNVGQERVEEGVPPLVANAPAEPGEEAPPKVVAQDNVQAINEALERARAALSAERFDEAEQQIEVALTLDADNPQGQRLKERVASERQAARVYQAALAAQAKPDLAEAWAELQKAADLPEESVFSARMTELRQAVGSGLANAIVDDARDHLDRRDHDRAIELADEALAIEADHPEARDVRTRAIRARNAARQAAAQRDTPRPPPPKPDPKPAPDPSAGKSAQELYREARQLHTARDFQGALRLYQQAATKGNATAWRQMGAVHVALGNPGEAVKSFKRYLSLSPGAADAETVRDTIVRLGGTP